MIFLKFFNRNYIKNVLLLDGICKKYSVKTNAGIKLKFGLVYTFTTGTLEESILFKKDGRIFSHELKKREISKEELEDIIKELAADNEKFINKQNKNEEEIRKLEFIKFMGGAPDFMLKYLINGPRKK